MLNFFGKATHPKLVRTHNVKYTVNNRKNKKQTTRIVHFLCFLAGKKKCVDHSFSDVAHFCTYVVMKDVWIRPQRAAVTPRRATNSAVFINKITQL